MKAMRTSVENQWRNMGKQAAARGHSLDRYTSQIVDETAKASFIDGFNERKALEARRRHRAAEQHDRHVVEWNWERATDDLCAPRAAISPPEGRA